MASSEPSSLGRIRGLSNTSNTPSSTSQPSTSTANSRSPFLAVPGLESGSDGSSRLSDDVSASIQETKKPEVPPARNWKRLLLFVGPPVLVIIIIALVLGLYYGLHKGHSLHDGPVLDLTYSRYKGSYLSNNVSEFIGMRYAQPPTGDLRWRAPSAPKQTKKMQGAQEWGPRCVGVNQSIGDGYDEDCLYVNVWGPTNATADQKLPVMVFIQGGGYTVNSNARVNGSLLVENSGHNMVFVSFNYRVGLFGFLAGQDVKDDGTLNVGLHDQRHLLQWVQKYISKWGGDPDHVVIQGVSAGAGSVSLHLAAYGGRDDGLFVGAIAESTFWPGQHHYSDLEYQYDRLVSQTSCDGSDGDGDDKMACLRGRGADELQSHNVNMVFADAEGLPNFYWAPVTDDDFLRDTPYNMFQKGDFVKVPVLFGSTSNEGTNFTPNVSSSDAFVTFMENNYPDLTTNNTESMLDRYPLEPAMPMRARWFPSAARAYGEATFICPTSDVLDAFASANSSAVNASAIFSYRYNLTDYDNLRAGRGVPHTFETAAVFGPSMTTSALSYTTYNAPIVPVVQHYWISFVRSLNPNTHRYEGSPEWRSWGDTQRRLVLQLPTSVMEYVPSNETKRCQFWHAINETMSQ